MTLQRSIIIDASVAFKWVVAEELSDRAEALYVDALSASLPVLAPPHFTTEVINALYRRTFRQKLENWMSGSRAEEAIQAFLGYAFRTVAPRGLYARAFTFARSKGLSTIYDALYVVLAQMLDTDLWTADLALLRIVGSTASWVRWIGDYQPVSTE